MKSTLYKRSLAVAFVLTLLGNLAYAEEAGGAVTSKQLMMTLIFTMIVMSFVALVLAGTILALIRSRIAETKAAAAASAEEGQEAEATQPAESWWKNLWNKRLNDFVPVEEEASIDLGHDYDGIRELDNNLPPWWKYGFYFTIVFAFVYLIHFHVSEQGYLNWFFGQGISSSEEFAMQMEEAEEVKKAYLEKVANQVNEGNVVVLADASDISAGKTIYNTKNCQSCHGAAGEGTIGPNLTDSYWKHGGDIKSVFSVIKYGVPATAMIAWQNQIKPKEMQQLSSYIMSLQGTNPPNPKAPEGELFVPQADSTATDTTSIAMN